MAYSSYRLSYSMPDLSTTQTSEEEFVKRSMDDGVFRRMGRALGRLWHVGLRRKPKRDDESIDDEMRIVMVGKTGKGKSALGNSILQEGNCFPTSASGDSVTKECKFAQGKLRDGTKLCIVDTPGIFDTSKTNKETSKEIVKCVGLSSPGPHVFLFVLSIGRFTTEELDTVNHLVVTFGEVVINHVVIVFTHKDSLKHEKITLTEYLDRNPPKLSAFVQRCGSRYATIDNRASKSKVQADVDNIIKVVRKTIKENGGSYYTDKMYRAAEKILIERMRIIDENKQRKKRELQQNLAEIKQLKKDAAKQTHDHQVKDREKDRENREKDREKDVEIKRIKAEMTKLAKSDTRQEVREEMELSGGILDTILGAILHYMEYVINRVLG